MFVKAMIISVGGAPQPIIKSIIEYKPEFISFYASHDTCDKITEIVQEAKNNNVNFKKEITLVDNINDLMHCHNKAIDAVNRVISKNYQKNEVIVDYTGGTKNMSVALSLAAINYGFAFSYVGGDERTKDGVGIVVNGEEKIYTSINPWDFLALEEKKKISAFFNTFHFKAAKDIATELIDKTVKNKHIFRKIGFFIDLYYYWDLFNYKNACQIFNRKDIQELSESDDKGIKDFTDKTFEFREFLEKLSSGCDKPSINLILDLFSNAQRRFEQGKIDDAILRLYRIVEMIAQEKLLNNYQINTSDVPKNLIPEPLLEEFMKKNADNFGKIKIGLNQSYRLLQALNDDLGAIFVNEEANFKNIQNARNNSFLAHGFSAPKEDTYNKLKDFILRLGVFNEKDVPVFPLLEFKI